MRLHQRAIDDARRAWLSETGLRIQYMDEVTILYVVTMLLHTWTQLSERWRPAESFFSSFSTPEVLRRYCCCLRALYLLQDILVRPCPTTSLKARNTLVVSERGFILKAAIPSQLVRLNFPSLLGILLPLAQHCNSSKVTSKKYSLCDANIITYKKNF